MSNGSSRKVQEICVVLAVPEPRHTRLMLTGEIDMSSTNRLDAVLEEIGKGPAVDVVADLSGVAFLGTTGLSFLVRLQQRLSNAGRRLTVFNPSPIAQVALHVSALDQALEIDLI
jgi:anti-sigma B factor antagonist